MNYLAVGSKSPLPRRAKPSASLPRKRQSRKYKAMFTGLLLSQEQAWTPPYAGMTHRPPPFG